MPDVKIIRVVSEWLTYTLDAPNLGYDLEVKLKLRFTDAFDRTNYKRDYDEGRAGDAFRRAILDVVADWDFTHDGAAVPCTTENKDLYLKPMLSMWLKKEKPEDTGVLLGPAILEYAQNRDNFLKN